MKLVSWDIGIKNLAYCIMEYDENDKLIPFKITKWNIINLLGEKSKIKVCQSTTKNNKPCENKASAYFYINGKNINLCGMHKKMHKKMMDDHTKISFIKNKDSDKSCPYINKKNVVCNKKALWGGFMGSGEFARPLHFCTSHKNVCMKNEERELELKKIKKIKCKDLNVTDLRITLLCRLNGIPELLDVKYVVIENQPAFKNPVAKSIQDTIFTWFLMKGIIEKDTTKSIIEEVRLVAPSNKLKLNEDKSVRILSKAESDRETYILTKELGIEYCKKLIEHDKKWLEFLETKEKSKYSEERKIDDLCDSMLLGAQFITRKHK
jgi:hypothetical protein